MKLYLLSLGCAKNQVDSEHMLGDLQHRGFGATDDPSEADIIIVNTCGFIEPAINESIDAILELSAHKKSGSCRRLIVTGCLPQRYGHDIAEALPEVDLFIGTGGFNQIADYLLKPQTIPKTHCIFPEPSYVAMPNASAPRAVSASHTVYIKIAEGCNRNCTFCIIPKLRGVKRSRSLKDIKAEAGQLIQNGAREIILVAQETTAYGGDLIPPVHFSTLLGELAGLYPDVWIRFLYGHPESLDHSIIETVSGHDNICSYFDLPIQHAAPSVLKRMGRSTDIAKIKQILNHIRNTIPDAVLRTSIIVGFPGETEDEFGFLADFIEAVRFDHLGVFLYSDAEDIASHQLKKHVRESIKQKRHDYLMQLQETISARNLLRYQNQTMTILIDGYEDGYYHGRSMFQAPDVDGLTLIRAAELPIGEFVTCRIDAATNYDLIGEPI